MTAIVLRADASPAIGGGHVMRMLSLATALRSRGAACRLAVNAHAEAAVPALARSAFPIDVLDAPAEPESLRALKGPDIVVIDHYGLDARYEAALSGWARAVVVVDDLADRPHSADLLIDSTPGRRARDYDGLVPPGARVLAGPAHAFLRPAFLNAREAALARRRAGGAPRRLLVSLGLTDVGAVTGAVADALSALPLEMAVDVVLGPSAPSLPRVEALAARDPRFAARVDVTDMAGLMADADLAVGAGGQTALERACLGLPTVMAVLADNQRMIASAFAAAGAAEIFGAPEAGEIAAQVGRLWSDDGARRRMAQAGARLVDGRGAQRSAEAIMALSRAWGAPPRR